MSSNEQKHTLPSPCYMVAFDHRRSFGVFLEGLGVDSSLARRAELKQIIWQGMAGVLAHIPRQARAAILIDREHRSIVAEAIESGVSVAIALEASGCATLTAEARPSVLREDLRMLGGGYGKALVRWHPDDPASVKRRQLDTLRELDQLVREADSEMLLELLIRPSPLDGAAAPTSGQHWDENVLPHLQYRFAEDAIGSGIAPMLWKVEGHPNVEGARVLAELVGSARPDASILLLGGGSEVSGLGRVFACRTAGERYNGFAVGRSIWQNPIAAMCRGEISEKTAIGTVGENFLAVIGVFQEAGAGQKAIGTDEVSNKRAVPAVVEQS
jgi:myo-inositol catabolism protein IolC